MTNPFGALRDKIFLKLYLSQTISLLGDAFTWVGIALLAFQFGDKHSAAILSTALTLRVTAFAIGFENVSGGYALKAAFDNSKAIV